MKCRSTQSSFPTSLHPSRLQPSILKAHLTTSFGSTAPTLSSSVLDSLTKRQHELINASRTQSFVHNYELLRGREAKKFKVEGEKDVVPKKKIKMEIAKSEFVSKADVENFARRAENKKLVYVASDVTQTESEAEDSDVDWVVEEKIFKEISYENAFEKVEVDRKLECTFEFEDERDSVKDDPLLAEKKDLLNMINLSLVENPNFNKKTDGFRMRLVELSDRVAASDPEFILKLCLYTRKHLNIRTVSNFLLAFAARNMDCKRFLPKYFGASVVLPTDWISVAEFAETFGEGERAVFPASLRRVMVPKFVDFDKYQLGKYNKEKSIAKKKAVKQKVKDQRGAKRPGVGRADRQGAGKSSESDVKRFTLKQLIRKLHISEPVENVMCLVGKRYPDTMEKFFRSRLPGLFEEEKAGKRMRLPVPETWETQLSLKGNKAKVWEELIDHKKLPFMAMLRNLRNLILANISEKHHLWVLRKLTDEGSVVNSKQFPFRFFSAFEVLDQLEKDQQMSENKEPVIVYRGRGRGGRGGRGRGRGRGGKGRSGPVCNRRLIHDLSRYREALDKAVKIATLYNVPPIPGRTLIFCCIGRDGRNENCTTAKGLGKSRSVDEISVLLGLMCKHSCEESRLLISCREGLDEVGLSHKDSILKNVDSILKLRDIQSGEKMETFLRDVVYNKQNVDRWIVLGEPDPSTMSALDGGLRTSRRLVNPKLQGFHVDVGSSPSQRGSFPSDDHGFVKVFGFSEQVLRFIAERVDNSQITFVDNIDKLHKLNDLKIPQGIKEPHVDSPLSVDRPFQKLPRWSNCRIFISSTFLDMFSERDLLVRYIFQELKARARTIFVNIFDVDLRWGITEEQAQDHRTVQLCLSEVSKCQFFVGILGERYGWCPDSYEGFDLDPGMEWLDRHPKGASLTELEFYQCFNSLDVRNKAFFYFRDPAYMDDVPAKYHHLFVDDNRQKLNHLKRVVMNSGAEVYNNYPCSWGGMADNGKVRVTDLEEFGRRVLDNLWNAIQRDYSPDSDAMDEGTENSDPHLSYVDFLNDRFVGRQNLVNKMLDLINTKNTGLIALSGKPGSGKSALMASVYRKWMESAVEKKVLIHCVGAFPGSEDVVRTLLRLTAEMRVLPVPASYWEVATFDLACKLFHKSLTSMSANNPTLRVQIFLDGVDHFSDEHQARLMTWLPEDVPKNVLLIVSTNENSPSHMSLKSRLSLVGSVSISDLNLTDKQAIVRHNLKSYSKSLAESAFNNQMRLITSKRESSSPLYLALVCDEMRQFGDFEQVSSKIASLPPTLSKLMQDVMSDLEKKHGEEFVRILLSCLACSMKGKGLKEEELQNVLSMALGAQWTEADGFDGVCSRVVGPEQIVAPSKILLFMREAGHLLNQNFLLGKDAGEVLISIKHKDVVEGVKQRYLSSAAGKKFEKFVHVLLSASFYRIVDPSLSKKWKQVDGRILNSITYHLTQCCDYRTLACLLTDLSFVQYKFILRLSRDLLEDYQVPVPANIGLRKDYEQLVTSQKFKDYKNFVFKNAHLLKVYPHLIYQQAFLEAEGSEVRKEADDFLLQNPSYDVPFARWLNMSRFTDLCVQTVDAEAASCLALSADDKILAAGFETAVIKLHDTSDCKVTSTLIGHSSSITSICFVSNIRLCSSSKDHTLSLWDVPGAYRLAVMEGHNREVSCCLSDHMGRVVVSVGWDSLINVWHGVTGTLEVTFPRDRRPINCASIHPEGQLVVTGSWDSTLKIWDVLRRQRKATLRGHRGSVSEVKFDPTGVHVCSIDIFGGVRIWSAQRACTVGVVAGESTGISRISYSPAGGDLLVASTDGTARVLSGSLGRCTDLFGGPSHGPSTCVTLDPCPVTPLPDVAVGYHSGSVRVFSCSSGIQVWESSVRSPPVAVTCLTFCWDRTKNKFLLIGSADGVCKLVLVKDNNKTSRIVGHHSASVTSVACSTEYLVSSGADSLIHLYKSDDVFDRRTGDHHQPDHVLEGHHGAVTCISVSSSGLMLASVGRDMTIIVWDLHSANVGVVRHKIEEAHFDWITCCSWSSESDEFLVTGSNDFNLKVWHVPTCYARYTLVGHSSMVSSVSYKRGCIVSSSNDGVLKVWSHKGVFLSNLHVSQVKCNSCDLFVDLHEPEAEDDRPPQKNWEDEVILKEAKGGEKKVDGKNFKSIVIASSYDDGTVRMWNPLESEEKHLLAGHRKEIASMVCGHGGSVYTSSPDGSIRVWKIPPSPRDRSEQTAKCSAGVTVIVCSPDGKFVCAGTKGGSIVGWNVADFLDPSGLQTPGLFAQGSTEPVVDLHFISDDLLASACRGGNIDLWKFDQKFNRQFLKPAGRILCSSPLTSMTSMCVEGSTFLVCAHFNGAIAVTKCPEKSDDDFQCVSRKEFKVIFSSANHFTQGRDSVLSFISTSKDFGIYSTCLTPIENSGQYSIKEIGKNFDPHIVSTSVFDPRASVVCYGTTDGRVFIFEVESDDFDRPTYIRPSSEPCELKIHRDKVSGMCLRNGFLFTASSDGHVKALDVSTLRVVGQFSTPFSLTSMVLVEKRLPRRSLVSLCGTEYGAVVALEWNIPPGRSSVPRLEFAPLKECYRPIRASF